MQFETCFSKMKKYYQLTLVVISLVSVGTLLFYRHEYYRLRYVLEVLNFFGKPGQIVTSTTGCYSHNVSENNSIFHGFQQPAPSWQRLTDRHFVYSAFWEETAQSGHVRALSLAHEEEKSHFKCALWYESRDGATEGKFFIQVVENKEISQNSLLEQSNGNIYYLYCKPKKSIRQIPYAVTFYRPEESVPLTLIPIYNRKNSRGVVNDTVICVKPYTTLKSFNVSFMLQFLSFYHIIGVNNVIVYGGNLPHRLLSFLKPHGTYERFGINILVLPWNPPFFAQEHTAMYDTVIELDCLLRVSGKIKNAAVVGWNEYIVPRYHHHLAAMLDDFDSGNKPTGRFKIPVITFCMDWADDSRATTDSPLAIRKTRYVTSELQHIFYVFRPESIMSSKEPTFVTQRMSSGIASVHRYTVCSFQTAATKKDILYEPAMLRFTNDFTNSKMLKQWKSGMQF